MEWTLDQIYQLSADPLLPDRARTLLKPRLWPVLSLSGAIIWGECRTKGTLRYRVAFHLEKGLYFSTSPAVKPDKYLIALLLHYFEDPGLFVITSTLPDWVSTGLFAPPSPLDIAEKEKQQADQRLRNLEKRLVQMAEGQRALAGWLRDVALQGLGVLQTQEEEVWEGIAARLTDAKLSGLARRIRRMNTLRHEAHWYAYFLRELADLYLWSEAFTRIDELPESLRMEVLLQSGWTPRREEIVQGQVPVRDDWFVMAQQFGRAEQLRVRHTWLWGEQSGKPALLLEYAWGEAAFEGDWPVGSGFRGSLYFYPSSVDLRAIPGDIEPIFKPFEPALGIVLSWNTLATDFATYVAAQPWLDTFPFFIGPVCIVQEQDAYFLVDTLRQKAMLEIGQASGRSPLVPFSGQAVAVFGTWSGKTFTPLSAWTGTRLVTW